MAGGIWREGQGVAAASAKLSPEIADAVGAEAESVLSGGEERTSRVADGPVTVLVHVCALPGPFTGLAGFALLGVEAAPGQGALQVGVGILLVLMLGMAGLLAATALGWSRRAGGIARALAEGAELPHLATTGEPALDRIVTALNAAGERLAQARRAGDALAARVAQSERLAALGRVAAGVAHELRNPLAAMRLRAENALAGDDARRAAALTAILGQIERLERLSGELLDMTSQRKIDAKETDVAALLEACAVDHRRAGVTLAVQAAGSAVLDGDVVRRALDAVVQNAVEHTPEGGTVTLAASREDGWLRLTVRDTGPGIPAAIADKIFEPFVTGRADGTGLGLAIARELLTAHGGRISLAKPGPGAEFVIEIPVEETWPTS
jgi:signal transduction histidine kinase